VRPKPGTRKLPSVHDFIGNRKASKVAEQNTNLTIAENKKLSELAYERDQSQIQQQNLYNSPEEQMKRYEKAGLNKLLIYQQGNPGNQSQVAKYNPPTVSYNYVPKFRGNEFDSLKNLPMAYAQIKNLTAVGKINEAKSVLQTSLSKYADLLAKTQARKSLTERTKAELEGLFGQKSLQTWFELKNNVWEMKPGMEELFVQDLFSKVLEKTTTLEKSQADINIKDQMLKNLSVLPWLAPLIQFMKMF